MFNLGLEKTEELKVKLPTTIGKTDAETEAPILWPPNVKNWFIWKDPDGGKDWRQEKGMTEDKLVEWCHWFNKHEFEWTLGVGEGQGSLACCSPWGRRVGYDWATEMNWTEGTSHPQLLGDEIGLPFSEVLVSFSVFFPCQNSVFTIPLCPWEHVFLPHVQYLMFRVTFP